MTAPSRTWIAVAGGVRVTASDRYSTNTTAIVHQGRAILVDPCWTPAELDQLAVDLTGLTVVAGFATHAHHDHLLWHPGFGSPPRWASPACVDAAFEHSAELVEALGPDWPSYLAALVGAIRPLTAPAIPWDGPTIEVVVHQAHAPGHAALWLPAEGVLLAGDMLSDIELPLPDETGLAAYAAGLDVLRPYVEQADVVVPGHGRPTVNSGEPMQRWRADRDYLDSVMTGSAPADQRIDLPDMAGAHQSNLELARQTTSSRPPDSSGLWPRA